MNYKLLTLLVLCGYLHTTTSDDRGRSWWNMRYDRTWNISQYLKDLWNRSAKTQEPKSSVVAQPLSLQRIELSVVQQAGEHAWPSGLLKSSDLKWSEVAHVEGGNCGYHALYNVMKVISLLTTPHDQTSIALALSELMEFKGYADFLQRTVPFIAQRRKPSHNISWLGGEEIESLYHSLLPIYRKKLHNMPIIVIEHVPVEGLDFSEHILRAIQKFVGQDESMLGIIWNSGARYNLDVAGGVHWVGFVAVNSKNKIRLYYMNSVVGLHPNFNIIESLLTSNVNALQRMIDAPLYQEMQRGIERMELNLKYVQAQAGETIFSQYLGCIEYNGPFVQAFNQDQLKRLQEANPGLKLSLESLNSNWFKYVKTKRPQSLEHKAQRFYGVWLNPYAHIMQAFDVSVRSCQEAYDKYRSLWLISQGRDMQVFNPCDVFTAMLHICMITWKDIKNWPEVVQQKILVILLQMIQLVNAGALVIDPDLLQELGGLKKSMEFMMLHVASVIKQEEIEVILAFMQKYE